MRFGKALVGLPRRAVRRFADWVDGEHPTNRRPNGANYIPNSNGEGGTVISSGHPGGGGG